MNSCRKSAVPSVSAGQSRRGIAAFWVILVAPCLVILLCMVIDIGRLWLARVELEEALEAAALASANDWGENGGGETFAARQRGQALAAANLIRGVPLVLENNYDNSGAGGPNQNDSCDGDLIFGAITTTSPPFEFNAGVPGGCVPASVIINAAKANDGMGGGGGADVEPRLFGIFYDEGPADLSIRSVSITIPEFPVMNNNQQPFFDTDKDIVVSIDPAVDDDFLNRDNMGPDPKDVRGLDPDPNSNTGDWLCTMLPPPQDNPDGDICFTFSDQVASLSGHYRTLTIHFTDGAFTSTNDPDTTDFLRYGASINQLNPPAFNPEPGDNNDADAIGQAGLEVSITFYNSTTMTTQTVTTTFVDDGIDNNFSEASISGSAGATPAVRAQKTIQVNSLCQNLLGIPVGPFDISAKSTARYDCATGTTALIRIGNFICPGP